MAVWWPLRRRRSRLHAAAAARTCASWKVVVAPQRPIRAFGGFINLGLPLSRWFNADPKGHNAGWQLFFDIGKDQVNNKDLNNPGFTATPTLCPHYHFRWARCSRQPCTTNSTRTLRSASSSRSMPLGLRMALPFTTLRETDPTNGRITARNSGRFSRSRVGPGRSKWLVPIDGSRIPKKGGRAQSGDGPQLSLSSQASSNKGTYCAGRAKGAQCTGSARPASRIVRENRVRNGCIRSVWRSWVYEYA